jgi:phage-related protein
MTGSLGEAVLDLSAPIKPLERDLNRAKGTVSRVLGGIGGSIKRIFEFAIGNLVAGGIRQISRALGQLVSNASQAVGRAQMLEKQLQGLLTEQLMYARNADGIYQQVRSFGEASEIAAGQVGDLLEFVSQLALASPFETTQVEEIIRLGIAADLTADKVTGFTAAFLDYAAVHGITSSNLAFAADQFLQLRKAGTLTSIDLRQLRRLGIDVAKILGSQLGMSVEQFNAAVKESPELMDDLFDSFVNMASGGAAGAAADMAKTMDGQMATMADIIELGSRNLFRPIFEAISPLTARMLGKLSDFATSDKLKQIGIDAGFVISNAIVGVTALLKGDDLVAISSFGSIVEKLFGADALPKFFEIVSILRDVRTMFQTLASGDTYGAIDQFGLLLGRVFGEDVMTDFDYFRDIITDINDVFLALAEGDVYGAIENFGVLLQTVFGDEALEAFNWLRQTITDINDIFLTLGKGDTYGAIELFGELLGRVFGQEALDAFNWLRQTITDINDIFLTLGEGDTYGAVEQFGELLGRLFGPGALDAFNVFRDILTDVNEILLAMGTGDTAGALDLLSILIQKVFGEDAQVKFDNFREKVAEIRDAVIGFFTRIWEAIMRFAMQALPYVVAAITVLWALIKAFVAAISPSFQRLWESAQELWTSLGTLFSTLGLSWATLGNAFMVVGAIIVGIIILATGIIAGFVNAVVSGVAAILEWWSYMAQHMTQVWDALWAWLEAGFTFLLAILEGDFPLALSVLGDAWSNWWLLVEGIIKLFIDGFTGAFVVIGEILWGFVEGLIVWLDTLFTTISTFDLVSAGKDLVQGFINGITSKFEDALAIVSTWGGRIKDAIAGALGMQSPSKVTEELGDLTAEGYSIGIVGGFERLLKRSGPFMAAINAIPDALAMNQPKFAMAGAGVSAYGSGEQQVFEIEINANVAEDIDITKLARRVVSEIQQRERR